MRESTLGPRHIDRMQLPPRPSLAYAMLEVEAREEEVGPAVVFVGVAAAAVGYAVADNGNQLGIAGNHCFNGGDEVPVLYALYGYSHCG